MNPCRSKTPFILLVSFFLVIFGCSNSDSNKNEKTLKSASQLIGTWQQTAIGKDIVSGVVVKVIFTDHTLTMDAPGCMIIGEYTIDGNVITYTITAVQGQRCASTQEIGKSDSVYYSVTDSQLTLTPVAGGEESRVKYKRIK